MANVSSSNGLEKRPKLRFPGFDEPWEHKELLHYLVENTDRNKQLKFGKENVLSVSGEYGIVNQIAFQGRSFAGESVADYHVVETDDIVYTKSPLKANPYGIIKVNKGVPGIVSTLYAVYHPLDTVVPRFVDFYFSNDLRLNKFLKPLVNIGAKHDMKVNNTFVLTGTVVFPPLREQQKIVDFLTILDRRIDVQRKKVEALKKYKRGAVDGLLSRKIKFRASDDWEEIRIADLFSPISDKGHGDLTVLTIVQGTGTLPRDSVDRRISYDKTNTNTYKRVIENDFILHLRSFEGGLEIANSEGIVSPAYTILRASKEISPMFYYAYFRSYWFISNKLRMAVEGIRDGKSINMDTFWNIKIPYPSLAEQIQIAEYLEAIDLKLANAAKTLENLAKIRSGLMQQLFI